MLDGPRAMRDRPELDLLGLLVLVLSPLGPHDGHEFLLVPDGHPRGQRPHGVLEVRIQENLAQRIDESSARRVEHLESPGRDAVRDLLARGRGGSIGCGRGRFTEKHEDIPDSQLGRKWDRKVEER